ncbi:MAG: DUF2834 domain-containing protein [Cyclobacteriaceae bacterium]|nr:DUF2834 domain-containing protein [Cyclobacteriaceae bacterium]
MKLIYLILSIIGFIAPNIFVAIESVETGNVLLWLDPAATINGMFGNRIATAFIVDLLVVVFIFFFWTYHEAKRQGIKNVWVIWVLTMLFGMAGTFPLFLYLREKAK